MNIRQHEFKRPSLERLKEWISVEAVKLSIDSVLKKQGLQLTEHSTEIGTTLKSSSATATLKEVNHYDQIAFFPKLGAHYTKSTGVFDFDEVIFRSLWQQGSHANYNKYLRYYISDHRLLWAKFKC